MCNCVVGKQAKRARHYQGLQMEIGDIYIYIWYVQDTLVAQARCYVMWEELSANHFLNVVTTGNEH